MKSSRIFLQKEPDAYYNPLKNKPFFHLNHIRQTVNFACFCFSISKNDDPIQVLLFFLFDAIPII